LTLMFNMSLQGSTAGVRINGGPLIQTSYYKVSGPAGTVLTLTAVSCDSIQFVNWGGAWVMRTRFQCDYIPRILWLPPILNR
jgi:hypothetical protein